MQIFAEGRVTFEFDDSFTVVRAEMSRYYAKRWQSFASVSGSAGNKGTDFVAYEPLTKTLWLIEVKDYRYTNRTKPSSLGQEFAEKCRDTLGWLAAVGLSSWSTAQEKAGSKPWRRADSIRCVLHVEQGRRSKLFPPVIDPKNLKDLVRRHLKALDPQAKAGEAKSLARSIPFTISV